MQFSLQPWSLDFLEDISIFAANQNIAAHLRNVFPYPYTRQDAKEYICSCMQQEGKGQICRAIVVNDKAVGSIGIFMGQDVYEKSAEIGYWLAEPYWGKGIMTQAVKQMCKKAFLTFDLVRIQAAVFANNPASCHVLEKAGFHQEGILRSSVYKWGQLMDSILYALVKEKAIV